MKLSVTQISGLFHEFEHEQINPTTNPRPVHNVQTPMIHPKSRSMALLFATNSGQYNPNRSELQKKKGIEDEKKMLDMYEKKSGKIITRRNEEVQDYKFEISNKVFHVTGRVDGIVEDDQTIIEHKRRIRGLLHRVPFHEKVQCYLYMKMFKMNHVNLIESFGDHIEVHEFSFCEKTWDKICMRWYMLS